jgi:hypothetical protein
VVQLVAHPASLIEHGIYLVEGIEVGLGEAEGVLNGIPIHDDLVVAVATLEHERVGESNHNALGLGDEKDVISYSQDSHSEDHVHDLAVFEGDTLLLRDGAVDPNLLIFLFTHFLWFAHNETHMFLRHAAHHLSTFNCPCDVGL